MLELKCASYQPGPAQPQHDQPGHYGFPLNFSHVRSHESNVAVLTFSPPDQSVNSDGWCVVTQMVGGV